MFFENPLQLGKHFRKLRLERNLSLRIVAEQIGCRSDYLSLIESGKIYNPGYKPSEGRTTWKRLAEIYKVSYEEIRGNSFLKSGRYIPKYEDPNVNDSASLNKSVLHVLNSLIAKDVYRKSKIAVTKTYLLKFIKLKGYSSLNECPIFVFDNSLKSLLAFINESVADFGKHALRNFKNTISFFVRQARRYGFLRRQAGELISDYTARARRKTRRPENPGLVVPPYILTGRELQQAVTFAEQLADYCDFSTNPFRTVRSIRKRKSSMDAHTKILLLNAGFLVHHRGVSLESLSLEKLTEKEHATAYVKWMMKRNREKYVNAFGENYRSFSGVTRGLENRIIALETLAKHYLKNAAAAEFLKELRRTLDFPTQIRNKESFLVSLRDLERMGRSLYPFNELRSSQLQKTVLSDDKRLLDYMAKNKAFPEYSKNGGNNFRGRRLAHRVCFAVMTRLLIRLPLRQRNLREMRLDKNLSRDGDKYVIRFQGKELKVERRGDQANKVLFTIERDETGFFELLEEWLNFWRPCLVNFHQKYIRTPNGKAEIAQALADASGPCPNFSRAKPADCGAENNSYVFLNMNGMPWALQSLTANFRRFSYRYLGIALTPHLVRDCFATEYIRQTRARTGHADIVGAAEMLGDTIGTVEKHYAHILGEEAQSMPKKWLREWLQDNKVDDEKQHPLEEVPGPRE